MFKMARINLNLKPHLISVLGSALQMRVNTETNLSRKKKKEEEEWKCLWFVYERAGLMFLFLTKELSYAEAAFPNFLLTHPKMLSQVPVFPSDEEI